MSTGSDFVAMLMEMGFSKEKAEKGLSVTGHKSVEAAMEWIFNNMDEPTYSTPEASSSLQSSENGDSGPAAEAKSLKCDDCGKLFRSQIEVEFHASKTNHSNFSESTEEKKPLTDEEKQEQLRKIEEKLKLRRKEREEKDKTDALLKEKSRIKSGKDLTEAKRKMEELEMKKIIEQRKREKEEEKQARERVKRLIEADKLARKGIYPESKQSEMKNTMPAASAPLVPIPLTFTPKEYTHTKIQIRLTNGTTLTETFSITEQLAAVRLYIEMHRTDGTEPFLLMTNFPRKVFTEEEFGNSLENLKNSDIAVSRMCVLDGDKENHPCSQQSLSGYLRVEHCSTCDTDLCNSAPTFFKISSLLGPFVVLLSKLNLL